MKGAVFLLLLLPSIACAEIPASQGFSFISSFIQMCAALSIVIGLILLTRYITAKVASGGASSRLGPKHIRLVETRYISPKKSLMLFEVGGEYLLIANTDQGLSLIKKVSMIEEIEVIEESGIEKAGFLALLRKGSGGRRG